MNKVYIKCLECGSVMRTGEYVCPVCGMVFSDDDVQVMMDVYRKEKRSILRRLMTFGIAAVICFLVFVLIFGGFYMAKESRSAVEAAFCERVNDYLLSCEGVYDCTSGMEAASIVIDAKNFRKMSADSREILIFSIVSDITDIQKEYKLKPVKRYEIIVLDRQGRVLFDSDNE